MQPPDIIADVIPELMEFLPYQGCLISILSQNESSSHVIGCGWNPNHIQTRVPLIFDPNIGIIAPNEPLFPHDLTATVMQLVSSHVGAAGYCSAIILKKGD